LLDMCAQGEVPSALRADTPPQVPGAWPGARTQPLIDMPSRRCCNRPRAEVRSGSAPNDNPVCWLLPGLISCGLQCRRSAPPQAERLVALGLTAVASMVTGGPEEIDQNAAAVRPTAGAWLQTRTRVALMATAGQRARASPGRPGWCPGPPPSSRTPVPRW